MDKKTTGIIATIVTALLCGCPGLFLCLFGAISAAGLGTFEYDVLGTGESGGIPIWAGIAMMCLSIFIIAIPIVVGVLMLRKQPAEAAFPPNEPIPPAI